MRLTTKKKTRAALAFLLTVLFVFPQFSALADGGVKTDFTGIVTGGPTSEFQILDQANKVIVPLKSGDTGYVEGKTTYALDDGAHFKMKYVFDLPGDNGKEGSEREEYEYLPGDYFTFPILPAIAKYLSIGEIKDSAPTQLLEEGEVIAYLTISKSSDQYIAKVTFSDPADGASVLSVQVDIDGVFNVEKLEESGTKTTEISIADTTYRFIVPEVIPDPRNPAVSVTKTGEYLPETGRIQWNISVTMTDTKGELVTLTDTFSANQAYVTGSFAAADTGTPAVSPDEPPSPDANRTLTYTFNAPDTNGGVQTYKFTYQTDFVAPGLPNNSLTAEKFTNTAAVNLDRKPSVSTTATVQFDKWIKKEAETVKYGEGSGLPVIPWKITIKNYDLDMSGISIQDVLPEGLALVDGTLKLGTASVKKLGDGELGAEEVRYAQDGNSFTVSFPAGSAYNAETYTLTFDAQVTADSYVKENGASFVNAATLSFADGNKWAGWGTVGVTGTGSAGNGIVSKSTNISSGNYEHGKVITWTVVLNRNNISLTKPKMTDVIPKGLEYVEGSFTLNGGTVSPVTKKLGDGTTELTYQFENISTKQTITYQTKLAASSADLKGSDISFSNKVKLEATELPAGKQEIVSTPKYSTQFIEKTIVKTNGQDYDYSTRTVTWKIEVNRNKTPLTQDVTVVDTLPEGMVIKEGTFTYLKNGVTLAQAPGTLTLTREGEAGPYTGFTFTFTGSISDMYTIQFQTEMTDEALVNQGKKTKDYTNTAELWEDKSKLASDISTVSVKNPLIVKGMEIPADFNNKGYIDWSIEWNQAMITMKKSVLTDSLPSALDLDVSSVKVYEMEVLADGTLEKAENDGAYIVLTVEEDYTVSYEGNVFTLTLLKETNKAYRVEFSTDIVPTSLTGISNTVDLKMTQEQEVPYTSTKENTSLNYNAGGSALTGNGSLTFKKVKPDGSPLEGVTFRLARTNTEFKAVSDENGVVTFSKVFSKGLKYLTYTLIEEETVNGYLLSKESWTVRPTRTNPHITLDNEPYTENQIGIIQNELAVGNITFFKFDDNADVEKQKPLLGAEFTLFDADGENPIQKDGKNWTATSGADGKVEFIGVPLGTYVIKETRPPAGYYRSDKTLTVTLKYASLSDGRDDQSAVADVVINDRYTNKPVPAPTLGAILVVKSDASDQTPLAGATFTLYSALTGNALTSVTTGPDGKALFADLLPGSYLVKETEAPEGYILSATEKTVTVISGGTSSLLITNEKKPAETTTPPAETTAPPAETTVPPSTGGESSDNVGEIRLKKTGKDGAALAGATLTLYNESGEVVAVKTSGADGLVTFADLPLGTYYLEETNAPDGYLLPGELYTIALTEETAVRAFYFRNTMPGDPDQPGLTEIPDGEIPADKTDPPETGTGTVVVPETPGELPKTGGFRSYAMPIGIMLLVLAAGLIAVIAMRKKI